MPRRTRDRRSAKTAKKTGHKVKNTTKKAVNKAAGATENGAAKVRDKTDQSRARAGSPACPPQSAQDAVAIFVR